jgi:hypothetical protein
MTSPTMTALIESTERGDPAAAEALFTALHGELAAGRLVIVYEALGGADKAAPYRPAAR